MNKFASAGLLSASALFASPVLSAPGEAISNARVFAFAQANFPVLFSGAPVGGVAQQYDFRFYPTSKNYLGVDTNTGIIYLLGPATGGALVTVGPVTSFAGAITAWEPIQIPNSSTKDNVIGLWGSTCHPQPGTTFFWKCTFEFKADGTLIAKDVVFSDSACAGPQVSTTQLEYAYTVGAALPDPLGAAQLDLKMNDIKLTYNLQSALDAANASLVAGGCPASFAKDVPTSVTTLGACQAAVASTVGSDLGVPTLGKTLYSLFKVDTSGTQPLMFHSGSSAETMTGDSPTTRQTKLLDTLPHYKTQ